MQTPSDLKDKLNRVLTTMIKEKQFPGAVYAVMDQTATCIESALGYSHPKKNILMNKDILFDMASLTKVCVTLPSILLFVQEGILDLDDSLQHFFPTCKNNQLTVKHLLTHTSGLPWHVPFFNYGWAREEVLDYILTRDAEPGERVEYSDLNFILLGFLVEKLAGMPLDTFAEKAIFGPIGMQNASFNPKVPKEGIAPTEWDPELQGYQWGKVHDENARHFGGVSGHAGLFASLQDLKNFCYMVLNEGRTVTGQSFLSPQILKISYRNFTKYLNLNRGLGWQLVDKEQSPFGYFMGKSSFGHTGFTGTSIGFDPDRGMAAILLTNRVYYGRDINANRFRRSFYTLISN